MPKIIDSRVADAGQDAPAGGEDAREHAIKQIERRRRFQISAVVAAIGVAFLAVIWAITEYHNAGGWPVHGFSQSSGAPGVWNMWIIYPVIGVGLLLAAHAWSVYVRKPISENEIKREIERQSGSSR